MLYPNGEDKGVEGFYGVWFDLDIIKGSVIRKWRGVGWFWEGLSYFVLFEVIEDIFYR